MRLRYFFAFLLLWLSSCIMQNMSPETRLRDSVVELNEETRWGRMDVAKQRVAPGFREQFVLSHARWGSDIQIADSEILGVNADKDDGAATSRVAVRWYDQRTMLLSDTILRQTWQSQKQTYILMSESIESGHPGLLAMPEIEPSDAEPEDASDLEAEAEIFGAYVK
jgi:hypothetical protein